MILPSVLFSQLKDNYFTNVNLNKQNFYLDPLVFYDKDSINGRLDLYIELPLETVQFKYNSSTDRYDASVDYTVNISNSLNKSLYNNTFSESFSNTENEQKNIATKSVYSIRQFYLPPDRYKLSFDLRDKNSTNEYTRDTNFTVNNYYNTNPAYSSIMLLSDYKVGKDGKKEITPIVNDNIGNFKDFFIFFEITNKSDSALNKEYSYRIYNEKGKNFEEGKFSSILQPGINKVVEKISEKNFIIGAFKLDIVDRNINEVVNQRYLKYFWEDLPVNVKDLNAAIEQLIYIASSDELSYIKKAKTDDEKERRFLKFWKDKNANSKSTKNNIMIEYYNRIKIANERYSHYVEGWKTDMGMVFIVYGNPSNIDRHPFDYDSKPYEIWEYYDYNKRFVFVDYTGFGDFRLITPFYDSESTRLHF